MAVAWPPTPTHWTLDPKTPEPLTLLLCPETPLLNPDRACAIPATPGPAPKFRLSTPAWLLEADVAIPTTPCPPVEAAKPTTPLRSKAAVCPKTPLPPVDTPATALFCGEVANKPAPVPFCWTSTIWSLVVPLNLLGGSMGPDVDG